MEERMENNSGRKYRSYTFAERMRAVEMNRNGMSSLEISSITGIDSSLIRGWIRKYKADGPDGLRRKSSFRTPVPQDGSSETVGLVRYMDNPAVMELLVRSLTDFGVVAENVKVVDDPLTYVRSLDSGTKLVINSLFDLAPDFKTILLILSEALTKDIKIVSVKDLETGIDPGDTAGICRLLAQYAETSDNSAEDGKELQMRSRYRFPAKTINFNKALELYKNGYSMAKASMKAGCKYHSFRYWYIKNFGTSGENVSVK